LLLVLETPDITIKIMAPHGLSETEVEDLKEAFAMFDVDGGGKCCHWGRVCTQWMRI
jgi:hypothetical protein